MGFQLRSIIAVIVALFYVTVRVAAAIDALEVPVDTSNDTMPSLVSTAANIIQDQWKLPTKWQGKATVEVYIVSDNVVNVGNVTGPVLYDTVWHHLDDLCPVRIGRKNIKKCYLDWLSFPVRYLESGKIKDSLNQVKVFSSYYESLQIRNLLIGAIAGAYQAMSETQRNCYSVDDESTDFRYCNVAIRVGAYTPDSHMYITVTSDISDDDDGTFRCCESRQAIDWKLDGLKSEMKSAYPTTYSMFRNVECHLGCTDDQRAENVDIDWMLAEMIRWHGD